MKIKIISLLSKKNYTREQLKQLMNIRTEKEEHMFKSILYSLVKSKVIQQDNNEYKLINNPYAAIGIFSQKDEHYGFVDTKTESFYIHGSNTLNAQNGDKVKYMIVNKGFKGRKSEGKVLEILEAKNAKMIGEIIVPTDEDKESGKLFSFKPYRMSDYKVIFIHDMNLTIGDIVVCEVLKMNMQKREMNLKVEEIIGQIGDSDIDIKQVLYEKNIPHNFPKEVLSYAKNLKIDWDKENSSRKDLTKETIITIDGEDAKDLDDAIMIKKDGDNYLLSVSIADVSYFVKKDSILDEESFLRGTSVYFPNKVIPMLPKEISNNLSSLNEDGKKLSITCDMTIDQNGDTIKTDIYPSIISSKGRMTYTEVNELFLTKKPIKDRSKEINDMLGLGKELSNILWEKKKSNDMIEFNLSEMKIILDDNNEIVEVKEKKQGPAEILIENFMVAANEAIATYFFEHRIPSIYRVHAQPLNENIVMFKTLVKQFDLESGFLSAGSEMSPKDYQRIIKESETKEYGFIIKKLAIQSMSKAIYDFRNKGHFGLGLKNYTHFTSPIRRYPDLIVHRLLRHHIFNKNRNPLYPDLSDICIRTSFTEKRSQEAERTLNDKKITKYMERFLGQEFEGFITSVQKWGFFVELPNTVEGLVATRKLEGTFEFLPKERTLLSKDKKTIYKIGMKVNVKLESVDLLKGICDFQLVKKDEDNNKE